MNQDPARLQRALQLFDAALEHAEATRDAWLTDACAGDAGLLAQVRAMLAADAGDENDPITPRLAALREDASGAAELPTGTRVGPWEVRGVLGRGGMGAVYRVARIDGAYDREAALKRIRVGLDSTLARQRFLRERQILARLQHPHIAGLLDGGVDGQDAPYFVMPRVQGERIDRWCDARKLDIRSRVGLLLQVLDAVAFAHRQLVVHRDLKPSNIVVDADGHAFLLDFGIAKLMEEDGAGHTRTSERAFTPDYASPEQLHGEPVSTATDLYQLGVLLYALLAQAHPYGLTGETPLRTRLSRMDGDPQPLWSAALQSSVEDAAKRASTPPALAKQLRGDLSAIAARCLVGDPVQRYGSVDALQGDLQAWLEGRPVSARAPTARYRMGRFIRRNSLAVGAAASVVVALCTGLGVSLWQAREARLQAQRADVVNGYLADVFRSIDPDEGLGPGTTARQLIDLGVARLDRGELRGQPAAEGKLRLTLADSYIALGEYPKADVEIARALALLPASAVDDVAQAHLRRGELRLASEDLDGMQRALQEGDAWLRAHATSLAEPEVFAAQFQASRAKLLAHREDYDDAVKLARLAWQRMRKARGDDDRRTRALLVEYADIVGGNGDFETAAALSKTVADAIRRARPINEFALATALHNQAVFLGRAGKMAPAIATEEQALAIRRRILPADHPYVALSLGELAPMLEATDRIGEALPLHAEAVAIMRRQPPGNEYDLGLRVNNWGIGCYNVGDTACAMDKFREAIGIWAKALPADHSSLLTARSNLASLYSRSGALPLGEAQLRQVVAALEASNATKPSADSVNALSNARGELTTNLLHQGRADEALALARQRWRALQASRNPGETAANALSTLALAELANDLPKPALAHAREALQRDHADVPGSRREAFALMTVARAQLASGDAVAAAGEARKAIAMFTAALSADHLNTGLARGVLARALLASGQRAEARKELDDAIHIIAAKNAWLPELAELRRLHKGDVTAR
ncbi:MAG: protein kinase [Xanthomonadales bacterium]|nr:protein kinase [Xanthomonadales bacterium]